MTVGHQATMHNAERIDALNHFWTNVISTQIAKYDVNLLRRIATFNVNEFRSATTPYLSRTMAFNRTLAHRESILMPMDNLAGCNSRILEGSAGIA
jgi:hypothetical protein